MPARPSNFVMLVRSILRRCPNCGGRNIFATYTELRESCPRCGLRLHRGESDYFIGAYLLNLVAVELLFALLLGIVIVVTYPDTPWVFLQWGGVALMAVGAVLCYPFAKSIWLAADLIFRPMTEEELAWHRTGGAADRELPHL
ncbi:MAG: putative rane protein [Gemmatimonadetes bacterium]|nr:putative rane protein [Gemmatimonadota bacterium]